MKVQFEHNLDDIETSTGFDPLPAGKYTARVKDINDCEAQSGNKGLEFVYEVYGEKLAGRLLWERCWLKGSDDAKTKIVLGILKSRLEACGLTDIGAELDPTDALGAEVVLNVSQRTIADCASAGKIVNDVQGVSAA